MFRFTRLYLVLLGIIATALAIVVVLGMRPYERALREQLERDATARLLDFLESERLDVLERVDAAELFAADDGVRAAFGEPAQPLDGGAVSAQVRFHDAMLRMRATLRDYIGQNPEIVAVVDASRVEIARLDRNGPVMRGAGQEPPSDLAQLPEVERALGGLPADGLRADGQTLYWTAVAPVRDGLGEVRGAVLIAEPIDEASLRGRLSRVGADGLLFRGGVVLASTLEPGPLLDAADRLVISVAANPQRHYGDDGLPTDVVLAEGEDFLAAMAPAQLFRSRETGATNLGFMSVVSAPRPPALLPQLLWEDGYVSVESRPLWVAVGGGLIAILLGLLVVQRDVRNALKRLVSPYKTAARESVAETVRRETARHLAMVEDGSDTSMSWSRRTFTGDAEQLATDDAHTPDATMSTAQAFPSALVAAAVAREGSSGSLEAISTPPPSAPAPASAAKPREASQIEELPVPSEVDYELRPGTFPSGELDAIEDRSVADRAGARGDAERESQTDPEIVELVSRETLQSGEWEEVDDDENDSEPLLLSSGDFEPLRPAERRPATGRFGSSSETDATVQDARALGGEDFADVSGESDSGSKAIVSTSPTAIALATSSMGQRSGVPGVTPEADSGSPRFTGTAPAMAVGGRGEGPLPGVPAGPQEEVRTQKSIPTRALTGQDADRIAQMLRERAARAAAARAAEKAAEVRDKPAPERPFAPLAPQLGPIPRPSRPPEGLKPVGFPSLGAPPPRKPSAVAETGSGSSAAVSSSETSRAMTGGHPSASPSASGSRITGGHPAVGMSSPRMTGGHPAASASSSGTGARTMAASSSSGTRMTGGHPSVSGSTSRTGSRAAASGSGASPRVTGGHPSAVAGPPVSGSSASVSSSGSARMLTGGQAAAGNPAGGAAVLKSVGTTGEGPARPGPAGPRPVAGQASQPGTRPAATSVDGAGAVEPYEEPTIPPAAPLVFEAPRSGLEDRLPTRPKARVPALLDQLKAHAARAEPTEVGPLGPATRPSVTLPPEAALPAAGPQTMSSSGPPTLPEAVPSTSPRDSLRDALNALRRLEARRAGKGVAPPGTPAEGAKPTEPTPPPRTAWQQPTRPEARMTGESAAAPAARPVARPVSPFPPPIDAPVNDYRALFERFIETRKQCREPTHGLSFERFCDKIRQNEETVKQQFSCRAVRLEVHVKNGRASVRAIPIMA